LSDKKVKPPKLPAGAPKELKDAAATAAAAATTAPADTIAPTTTDAPTEELKAAADKASLKPGYLIGILLSVVLLLGAGITFLATRGSDDNTSSDTKAPTSTAAPATTEKPIDEKLICARPAAVQQVLDDFGSDVPCTIVPDDFWNACDDLIMQCFNGGVPLIVTSPGVGITRDGSVPDVSTGQTGPSQAEHLVQVLGPLADATTSIDVASKCGNHTDSGQSTLLPTGVTSIKHPLLRFGDCRADVYYRTASSRQLIGSYDFTVTDTPVPPGAPVTDGISVPTEATLSAAGTTLGLLGDKPLDLACTWFIANSASLDLSQCLQDRWVFNAAYNDPRVASFGFGFVNPIGVPAPTAEQIASFGPSRLLGPGRLFPCGPGQLGYTACARNEAAVDTSAFVAGTVMWATPLNEMPDGTFVKISVGDYWTQLVRDGESWTLTAQEGDDSQVRAILRSNVITFMLPYDAAAAPDLTYTLSVGDDQHPLETAQTSQPVLGLVTSTQGPETPADFFQRLSNSTATGDLAYALERLHPLVLEAFPGEACRTELALRINPDYKITVNSVGATAPWTWELPDGRTYNVNAATTVSILLPGNTDPVDAHIVNIDRKYYWFTVCDER